MWDEFKEFAIRGNVVDMAVGIIIGGGFGKIVTSLVNDLIMPPLSWIVGRINFSQWFVTLSRKQYDTLAQAEQAGVVAIKYGSFLSAVIDFTIVAFVIFIVIHHLNKLHRQDEPPAKSTQNCPHCRSTISDRATRCPHCTSNLEPAQTS